MPGKKPPATPPGITPEKMKLIITEATANHNKRQQRKWIITCMAVIAAFLCGCAVCAIATGAALPGLQTLRAWSPVIGSFKNVSFAVHSLFDNVTPNDGTWSFAREPVAIVVASDNSTQSRSSASENPSGNPVDATSETVYGPPIPINLKWIRSLSYVNDSHTEQENSDPVENKTHSKESRHNETGSDGGEHKPQHSPLPAVNMTLVVEAVVDVSKMACLSLLWSAMFYVAAAN